MGPRTILLIFDGLQELLMLHRLLAMTYQLLTSVSNYSDFACTMTPGGLQNTGDNIENIHNLIHDCVGGVGHMAYPEVAGFDPVFWMHHA